VTAHDAIQARVHQARRDGPRATVDAALQRWFTKSYIDSHPDIADLIRTWVLANDPAIYPDIYQVLVDGVDELLAPEPPIVCPTLIMTAEEDYGNSPAMTRAIAAEIADARTVILPGLRHMAMVEAPEVFNRHLISFLDAVAADMS
jgi:pimeloyl-ACP methyl ester carboxylesterase